MPFVIGCTPPFGLQPGGLAVIEVRCDPPRNDMALRHLEQLPRDIGHGALIAHAGEVTRALRFQGGRPERVKLVVDGTSLGEATARLWRASGLGAVLVEVVAGRTATAASGELPVSRLDLAAVLQATLEERRFRWSTRLPEAVELQKQLDSFRLKPARRAEADLEAAREETSENLAIAAALCVWQGELLRPADTGPIIAETRWDPLVC